MGGICSFCPRPFFVKHSKGFEREKRPRLLAAFLALSPLFIPAVASATTSCSPQASFIGFSKTMGTPHWEVRYSGECTPRLVLYRYPAEGDVETAVVLNISEDVDPVGGFDTILGAASFSKNRDVREAAARKFWRTNYFPGFMWSDEDEPVPPSKPACPFLESARIYQEKEEYLGGNGTVVRHYFLPRAEAWLLIREHGNPGDSGNTADSVSIYHGGDCVEPPASHLLPETPTGNKISIAAGVRVRTAPQTNASEVARLPIGTIVQELERAAQKERLGQREDYWYRIAASGAIQGWVFGSLIAPYDPARRDEIYQQIAAERLKATDATFGDHVDLANFLKRAAAESTKPESKAELELGYLLALRRSLDAIPFGKSEQSPFQSWINAQSQHILFSEEGGTWIVQSEQFWALHEKYAALPIGERIAWEGATNTLPGECEGYFPCVLARINITVGKYLAYYPTGAHAEEVLAALSDSLQEYVNDPLSSEERSSVREELNTLRAVVVKTSGALTAKVLQQLDQLNKL